MTQISDFGYEWAQLLAKLADDGRAIKDLKQKVAEQNAEIRQFKPTNDSAAARTRSGTQPAANVAAGNSRRDAELAAAKTKLLKLQAKVDAVSQDRENATQDVSVLEARVNELTVRVRVIGQSKLWNSPRVGSTTRFEESAQAAIASRMCRRRTCADQLACAQAYTRKTCSRARNTIARGASSTRPLAYDDYARSVYARQRDLAKAGRQLT
jgi:chromosome segregation ATPase